MLGLVNLKVKFNLQVQYLCCDNAGENQAFKKPTNRKGWGLIWNIQPQVCPNKTGMSGISLPPFSTTYVPCLMVANLPPIQSGLWTEVANTATLLENNLINPNWTLSPFQQFLGKGKKHVLTLMQQFGEMCIATYKDNTYWTTLASHGTPGICVGYSENHPTGTYRIFNPKTKKVILTRDVTFLQKSYGELRVMRGQTRRRNSK